MSTILSRSEIASLICRGHLLVVHGRDVYRLNSWAEAHPAGSLAILHFVGRDAADEITAYHPDETVRRMRPFVVAQVKDEPGTWTSSSGWNPLLPPVQASTDWAFLPDSTWSKVESWKTGLACLSQNERSQQKQTSSGLPVLSPKDLEPPLHPDFIKADQQHQISTDYQLLHKRVTDEGLYESTPLFAYRWEFARYVGSFLMAIVLFKYGTSLWHLYLSAVCLGFFKHQLTFLAHDLGHRSFSRSYFWDRVLGIVIADFLGGLSLGWWADNHNIHHLVTNSPTDDPDIQHMPFFAISTRFLDSVFSTYYKRVLHLDALAHFVLPIQHKLYYLLMMFGRPNLFVNSYAFLLTKARPGFFRNLELVGIAFFWTWFSLMLSTIDQWKHRLGYVAICFIVTSPLHVQIVLSHFARSTEDCGVLESFAHRQLRTTMDVSCPEYLDFLHGGLHMQVSHHLFPRVPRHNLRRVNALVQEFAAKRGLEYAIYTFSEGNLRVLSVLSDVAHQLQVLGKVAAAQARGELH